MFQHNFDFMGEHIKFTAAPRQRTVQNLSSKFEKDYHEDILEKFRKFSEKNKEICTYPHLEAEKHPHMESHVYVTNSKYEGYCDTFGFNGDGAYTFPTGTIYKGEFEDDMFEGRGTLIFPCGTTVRGKWVEGVIIRPSIYFNRLMYDQDWMYCKANDRRFEIEFCNFLQPAGESYLTNDQPTKRIPDGYYDAGDGFFNPKLRCIVYYNDMSRVLRYPSVEEAEWIIEFCRKAPEECIGPRVVTDYPAPRPYMDDNLLSYSDLLVKELGSQHRSLKGLLDRKHYKQATRAFARRNTENASELSTLYVELH